MLYVCHFPGNRRRLSIISANLQNPKSENRKQLQLTPLCDKRGGGLRGLWVIECAALYS